MEILLLKNNEKFGSNCYILMSEESFSVIDPSVSYHEALKKNPIISELKPEYVLLTHGHLDHLWEISSYVEKGMTVLVSDKDGKMLSDPLLNCAYILRGEMNFYDGSYRTIRGGDSVCVAGTDFKVMETPGHTSGSLSYVSDNEIFTGDTLFAEGVYGRYDLPTSSGEDLFKSLRKLFMLDENLTVYPGHGAVTKLKDTKAFFEK